MVDMSSSAAASLAALHCLLQRWQVEEPIDLRLTCKTLASANIDRRECPKEHLFTFQLWSKWDKPSRPRPHLHGLTYNEIAQRKESFWSCLADDYAVLCRVNPTLCACSGMAHVKYDM